MKCKFHVLKFLGIWVLMFGTHRHFSEIVAVVIAAAVVVGVVFAAIDSV